MTDPTISPAQGDASLFASIDRRLTALERSQRQTPVGAAAVTWSAMTGVPVPATAPSALPQLTFDVPKSGRVLVILTASASWVDGSFRLRPTLTDVNSLQHIMLDSAAPLWDGFGNPAGPEPRTALLAFNGLPPGPATVTLDTLGGEWDSGTVTFDAVTVAAVSL